MFSIRGYAFILEGREERRRVQTLTRVLCNDRNPPRQLQKGTAFIFLEAQKKFFGTVSTEVMACALLR